MSNLLSQVDIGDQYQFQRSVGVTGVPELNSVGSLVTKWLPNVYIVAGIILFFLF